MALRETIIQFFIIACNINKKIVKGYYFKKVMNNDEDNYKLFDNFASECSSTLLCIMHRLGHCNSDRMLEEIISRHIEERREDRTFFENDAGGYISTFLRRNVETRGKLISNIH
jgi:hypothetical protein